MFGRTVVRRFLPLVAELTVLAWQRQRKQVARSPAAVPTAGQEAVTTVGAGEIAVIPRCPA